MLEGALGRLAFSGNKGLGLKFIENDRTEVNGRRDEKNFSCTQLYTTTTSQNIFKMAINEVRSLTIIVINILSELSNPCSCN